MDDIPQPLFYKSYLSLDKEESIDKEILQKFRDRNFTKFYIQEEPDPVVSVTLLSNIVKHSILKPQRLVADGDDYYVAIDLLTNTAYICYKNLLMIDIDKYKGADNLPDIIKKLQTYPQYFFRIYSSRNGYHIFILNKEMDYKSEESIRLMHALGCDFFYIVYSYLRGWSVRLNRKKFENPKRPLYTWVGDVIKGVYFSSDMSWVTEDNLGISTDESLIDILPNERLERLVDMHLMLTNDLAQIGISSMPSF